MAVSVAAGPFQRPRRGRVEGQGSACKSQWVALGRSCMSGVPLVCSSPCFSLTCKERDGLVGVGDKGRQHVVRLHQRAQQAELVAVLRPAREREGRRGQGTCCGPAAAPPQSPPAAAALKGAHREGLGQREVVGVGEDGQHARGGHQQAALQRVDARLRAQAGGAARLVPQRLGGPVHITSVPCAHPARRDGGVEVERGARQHAAHVRLAPAECCRDRAGRHTIASHHGLVDTWARQRAELRSIPDATTGQVFCT